MSLDNRELKKFIVKKNKNLSGSFLLKKNNEKKINRENYMIDNIIENKALTSYAKENKIDPLQLVSKFKEKYINYRKNWKEQPTKCITKKYSAEDFLKNNINPLCLDIEIASICDLACPFCYREYIATPDKIIDEKLCYDLIDQASNLKIPSIKFNWRGEPLLNNKIYDYISYAKKKGILETIINTNATNLTKKNSEKLIDSGLDLIIYSFDGGTKQTYEKMRPGRFKKNKFETVYENIKNFKFIRDSKNSKLPFTKIQMILTEDTVDEVENFFDLFDKYVDDVSVNQYTERGGKISSLTNLELKKYEFLINKHGLKKGSAYMRDLFGNISVAKGRLACEQPFQRMLVTYEGKLAMCCYDWGASYPIGFSSTKALNNKKDYDDVMSKVKNNKKGFELLKDIKIAKDLNFPTKNVSSLKNIWFGEELEKVRTKHQNHKIEDVSICKNCTFKDTYEWVSD